MNRLMNQLRNQNVELEVQEKDFGEILIAAFRWKGKYEETGKAFSKLFRAIGRYCSGKPFNLYYDEGYKEKEADVESCVEIKKEVSSDKVGVKILTGGKFVTLVHKGPYDQLSRSYQKILDYIKVRGYKSLTPSREVYVKGPGLIFKGNPNNYLTEIQIQIEK